MIGSDGRDNRRTKQFRGQFESLPEKVADIARRAFRQFLADPHAPALHNHELEDRHKGRHKLGSRSARVNVHYRAIYVVVPGKQGKPDVNEWYWIGSHEDYNNFTGAK